MIYNTILFFLNRYYRMSFPFLYNKFLPVWLKNTNNIPSSQNGNVSLLNDGKTELTQDATLLGNVGVRKATNASYSLDVSGNVNFSGNLTKNGVLYDASLVTLNTTQTITGTKTMTELLPLFSLNNTSYKIGTAAMSVQLGDCSNNIAIGTNALRGSVAFGTRIASLRNVILGDEAAQNFAQACNDNVIIGYQAFRQAYTSSSQNVIIGSGATKILNTSSRNVFIGYNCAGSSGAVGENTDCVVIGANSAQILSGRARICIVGASNGNAAASIGNGTVIVGAQNSINATNTNEQIIFGTTSLQNNTGAFFSCAIGANNLNNQVSGYYNVVVGLNNNILNNNQVNCATIGNNCIIPRSHCLYLGASTLGAAAPTIYQNVCIAFKNTIRCILEVSAASVALSFEDAETIVITSATTTSITLPTPLATSGSIRNNGAIFNLIKSYTSPVAITINAPAGQTLRLPTGATASTYTWAASEQYLQIACIANSGTSWGIINSQVLTSGNLSNVVLVNSTQTITGAKTFSIAPVMGGDNIITGTIPINSIVNGANILRDNVDDTISAIYTFSTPPVFGNQSIFSGYIENLSPNNANSNTWFGSFCCFALNPSVCTHNTALGADALQNTSGGGASNVTSNTAIGSECLYNLQTGNYNTCIGRRALFNSITGTENVALGYQAGRDVFGNRNTIIGTDSCIDASGLTLARCTALGRNTYIHTGYSDTTVIGGSASTNTAVHPSANSVILGRHTIDSTYIGNDCNVYGILTTNTINPYGAGTSVSVGGRLIANDFQTTTINSTTGTTCEIGNALSTTRFKGPLSVSNGALKINGISYLSGTNTLGTPLSEHYMLETSSNGTINLPAITSDIEGSKVIFSKINTSAIWTINRGGTNTFRLYKSSSTATATTITLDYTDTKLELLATNGGVWVVLNPEEMFYNFKTDFQLGRAYFPYDLNPTTITANTDWNASVPVKWYGLNFISITGTTLITLPPSTNALVPQGMRLKFRRTGGTAATLLQITATTPDSTMGLGATTLNAAGTASSLLGTTNTSAEVWLQGTTWYVMT